MNSALSLEEPFRYAMTHALVDPLVCLFRFGTRRGRENSIVLSEPAPAAPHGAASLDEEQERATQEFLADCRAAVAFAGRLAAGQLDTPSPELLALAKRALQRQQALKAEDVQTWAERLARDVSGATD
jgi:hypothetical protein